MAREAGAGPLRGAIWVFVSLAGVSCALTMLFLGARAVMGVGGFCAEGGPFEIRQTCPQGTTLLILGGTWGGLAFAGIYAVQTIKHQVPGFEGLLWSALFLSLGWNFLEFGLDPPGGGLAWGWLICAVVFGLMGGLPLPAALRSVVRGFRGERQQWQETLVPPGTARAAAASMAALRRAMRSSRTGPRSPEPEPDGDLVSRLERLARLHRDGALDDAEYEAAKRTVLDEERRTS